MTHIIDLSGPEGNAFAIAGIARNWLRQLKEPKDRFDIKACGSYEEVLDKFDELFKGRIDYIFLNDPREPSCGEEEDEYEASERQRKAEAGSDVDWAEYQEGDR